MDNSRQREWEERYKREKSEKSKVVYADLTFCSILGIMIVFLWLIYSWQGLAELYNQATPESTYSNQVAAILLIAIALIVTILYIRFKSSPRRSIAKSK